MYLFGADFSVILMEAVAGLSGITTKAALFFCPHAKLVLTVRKF